VWGEEKCTQGFLWGNLREGHHLEDPGVDGRILKLILEKWNGRMGFIDLVEDTNRWWALMIVVISLQVP
jgi:hypothetical protein